MPRSPIAHPAIALVCAAFAASSASALPPYADWNSPLNVESLPGSSSAVNTPAVDGCASLSRDGSTIFFNSNRGGTQDIYVATRAGSGMGFGTPERLPAPINTTTSDEFCPTFVPGNRLYFSRSEPGDPGVLHSSRIGPEGWEEPAMIDRINTPLMEEAATFYEDGQGRSVMLFSRRQASGAGGKIFMSVDGGAATPLTGGPDSSASDNRPSVTHDGRTIFFDSTRPGGLGGPDIWFATRETTDEPFGPAIHLATLSSPGFDGRPSISWDGSELLIGSARAGSESAAPDIWWASRDREHPGPKVIDFGTGTRP